LIFSLLFTLPGAPCIYYGDEIALPGRHDPDNRRSYPETLEKLSKKSTSLRDHFKRLIRERHENIALRRGSFTLLSCTEQQMVFARKYHQTTAVVGVNFSHQAHTMTFAWPDFLGEKPSSLEMKLPARGVMIQ
jgi:glycosidase